MVKAHAYGHGLIETATALAPYVDAFGVACLEEALLLRQAQIENRILLMEGFFTRDELPEIIHAKLDIVLHSNWQIEALRQLDTPPTLDIWVKLDTGMHRLGFPFAEFPRIERTLKGVAALRQLRVMTHLSSADCDTDCTTRQISRFTTVTDPCPYESSIANSAAIFTLPDIPGDWIRPGLALYGVSPIPGKTGADLGLQPVMTLQSAIIAIHAITAGETVGYEGRWQAARDSQIATIAIGYGDGYPRNIAPGTAVLHNGHLLPIVGRVSMDMIAVDVTDYPAAIGETVILWGKDLPVETIASSAGMSPYELLCHVRPRTAISEPLA